MKPLETKGHRLRRRRVTGALVLILPLILTGTAVGQETTKAVG